MLTIVYLIVILFLLLFPDHTAQTAYEALKIFAADIVPTLFPYMVFCRLLCARLRMLSIPVPLCAGILGILGGSPSGISGVAMFSARLSRPMLHALCALTGTISPMFLLSTVTVWSGTPGFGIKLLISHWCGAVFSAACAYILNQTMHPVEEKGISARLSPFGTSAIAQSIDAVLQVGGCIICYSVAAGILTSLPFLPERLGVLLHAMLEISGGTHAVLLSFKSGTLRSVTAAALCGFTGFSILSQNCAVSSAIGIRMPYLIVYAVLRALGAGMSMALFEFL